MNSQFAIVVGSGLAGLSASSEIIARGIPVCLLERSAKPGGNSMKASSGINGAPTRYQSEVDTSFYADTLKSAGHAVQVRGKERETLMGVLTGESKSAIDWLVDDIGVDLSVVARLGGHSMTRTHRGGGKLPPGAAIITSLLKTLRDSPLFNIETEATVTKILKSSEGIIYGIRYENAQGEVKELFGPVVFATGGFAGDAFGMLAKYRPDLAGVPSTNGPGAGSQELFTEVGGQLLDMEYVQIHPTAFIDPKDPGARVKFLAAEMLRGEGGILLDAVGERFVNELETRRVITTAIMSTKGARVGDTMQWDVSIVLDEGTYSACESHMAFYIWKNLMHKATISDLPSPLSSLATIRDYATSVSIPSPLHNEIMGRTSFGNWTLAPEDVKLSTTVYVGKVTPAVHFTMGGVIINENSEVLNKIDQPITGLWAAGEITGGVHGENRLGGSSLLECVVFGRRAGQGVARAVLEHRV